MDVTGDAAWPRNTTLSSGVLCLEDDIVSGIMSGGGAQGDDELGGSEGGNHKRRLKRANETVDLPNPSLRAVRG